MAITVGDKIKQKNLQTFKLMDAIDIQGNVTGWQNPVKAIFNNISDITGLSVGDSFIVRSVTESWTQFMGLDIYDRSVTKIANGIYILGPAIDLVEASPIYLVTAPSLGMIVFDKEASTAKKYDGLPAVWSNLVTAGGVIGATLRAKEELLVKTTGPQVAGHYDPATNVLIITTTLLGDDNVNLYVNGLKYSNTGPEPAISYTNNQSELTWLKANVGFDLIADDVIELEIFNNE